MCPEVDEVPKLPLAHCCTPLCVHMPLSPGPGLHRFLSSSTEFHVVTPHCPPQMPILVFFFCSEEVSVIELSKPLHLAIP